MSTSQGKRAHERVAKTSISLPPKLYSFATDSAKTGGYPTLSSFLQQLLRDAMSRAQATSPQTS